MRRIRIIIQKIRIPPSGSQMTKKIQIPTRGSRTRPASTIHATVVLPANLHHSNLVYRAVTESFFSDSNQSRIIFKNERILSDSQSQIPKWDFWQIFQQNLTKCYYNSTKPQNFFVKIQQNLTNFTKNLGESLTNHFKNPKKLFRINP